MRKFLVLILLIPHLVFSKTEKFALFGHSCPIIISEERGEIFINEILKEEVSYSFSLGDNPKKNRNWLQKLNTQLPYGLLGVPGNHDYYSGDSWAKNLALIQKTDANYILLNSGLPIEEIKKGIRNLQTNYLDNKPLVIICHHRVWDDNLLSNSPYGHDKSYLWSDFLNVFEKKPDYIIAGNSPGQYFGNQFSNSKNSNKNIVFWGDIRDGVKCYSVGSGGTRGLSTDVMTFVLGQWVNGELFLNPKRVDFKKAQHSPSFQNHKVQTETPKEKYNLLLYCLAAFLFLLLILKKYKR